MFEIQLFVCVFASLSPHINLSGHFSILFRCSAISFEMFLHYFAISYIRLSRNIFAISASILCLDFFLFALRLNILQKTPYQIWLSWASVRWVWKSKCTSGAREKKSPTSYRKNKSANCEQNTISKMLRCEAFSVVIIYFRVFRGSLLNASIPFNLISVNEQGRERKKKFAMLLSKVPKWLHFAGVSYWYRICVPNHRLRAINISDVMIWKCALAKS